MMEPTIISLVGRYIYLATGGKENCYWNMRLGGLAIKEVSTPTNSVKKVQQIIWADDANLTSKAR